MKRRIIITVFAFLVILSHSRLTAQDKIIAGKDHWQGLTLNVATVDNVKQAINLKAKEKTTNLPILLVGKWLDEKHKQRIFKNIYYENVNGYSSADFSFLDNRLVMIRLDVDAYARGYDFRADPNQLKALFGVEFTPLTKFLTKRMPDLSAYNPEKERASAKDMDGMYDLLAITESSFIVARVNNGAFYGVGDSFGEFLSRRGKKRKDDGQNKYPGKIMYIQMISRSIETKK
ncbi:MAG: hypothetical protein U0Z53_03515 [Blastocatellia bacterium]